jgi:hypothetical protein
MSTKKPENGQTAAEWIAKCQLPNAKVKKICNWQSPIGNLL